MGLSADAMKMPQKRHIVVFDLDGTLVDSVADIAAATNDTLHEFGASPLSLAVIMRMIGDGSPKLMERALAATGLTDELSAVMPRFMEHYNAHATRLVKPYPGVIETLEKLDTAGYRLGVCTNKPAAATQLVLEACGLARHFPVTIGGDSLPQRKPQPEPLFATIAGLGGTADQAVMVGDSATDLACAMAAGVPALILPSGYGVEEVARTPGFNTFSDLPSLIAALS
jgi:phosphoglycolate phosphatase